MDEKAQVQRAQVDRNAFAPLYRTYVGAVYRYCFFRLGSREDAEDATSEVFMKAIDNLNRHDPARSFRSWLFTIAHNEVIDRYRRIRPVTNLSPLFEVVDEDHTPEEIAIAHDSATTLRNLLSELPESQRQVIELRLAGLKLREIADVLGKSLPSVKIAQVRAFAKLRQLMAVEPVAQQSGLNP